MPFISTTSTESTIQRIARAGNKIHVPTKTNGVPFGNRMASRYSVCTRYNPLSRYNVSTVLYRTSRAPNNLRLDNPRTRNQPARRLVHAESPQKRVAAAAILFPTILAPRALECLYRARRKASIILELHRYITTSR